MRAGARSVTDVPVDVVVTSEAYGPELAQRFGACHIVMPRTSDGLSASLIRHGLVERWSDLAPATQAGLALKVAVVGAEPSEASTICDRVTEHVRSPLLMSVTDESTEFPSRDLYLLADDEGDTTTRFEDALVAAGQSWVLLTGTLEDRVRLAIRSVNPLLERRRTFAAPKTGPGFEATVIE
jgi:hypothetical protein